MFIEITMSSSMNLSTILLQMIEMLLSIFEMRLAMYPADPSSSNEIFFFNFGFCGCVDAEKSLSLTTSSTNDKGDKIDESDAMFYMMTHLLCLL